MFLPYSSSLLFVATQVGFGQNVSMSINPGIVGLVGLPEHNVLLAGQPSAPILVNTTDRAIIAYTVRWANSSGPSFSEINVSFLHIRAGQPPVIPARSQRAVDRDTNLVDRDGRPPGPPLAVILDAVIFEDGELVGPDLTHTFDMVSTRVKAEQEIHQKLLRAGNTAADRAAVWDEIGRAAHKSRAYDHKVDPRYARMQRAHADELLRVRDAQGEAAAIELLKTSAKYPKIWRRQ